MTPLQTFAIIIDLIERLRSHGSWCGETHIQKAAFLLEAVTMVPLEFGFVLYKHGPYSFDLTDRLDHMKSMRLVKLAPRPYPYGPSIEIDDVAETVKRMYAKTIGRFGAQIEFVAKWVDTKGVSELEKLATAVYVLKNMEGAPTESYVRQLMTYKPHVDATTAEAVMETAKKLVADARGGFPR